MAPVPENRLYAITEIQVPSNIISSMFSAFFHFLIITQKASITNAIITKIIFISSLIVYIDN